MDKVYEKANDQHVRSVYIYGKENDAYAYSDSTCTAKLTAIELKDLFEKNMIIISIAGVLHMPIGYAVATGVGTLSYIVPNGTTATSADIAGLKSKEYVAG
jgi:hypothetical protein